jgi:hypothetical protein
MTWAKIIAGVVGFLNWLARKFDEEKARQQGVDDAELEARRKADDASVAADAAADRVRDDTWRDIVDDPDNRKRRGRPL